MENDNFPVLKLVKNYLKSFIAQGNLNLVNLTIILIEQDICEKLNIKEEIIRDCTNMKTKVLI